MKRVALTTAATLATLTALLIMWQLSEIVILFGVSLAVASIVRARRRRPSSAAVGGPPWPFSPSMSWASGCPCSSSWRSPGA